MPQEVDWDNLLFTKPAEAAELIKRMAVAEARAQSFRDYADVTNREKWDRTFYSAYPSLASHKEMVNKVIAEIFTKVHALPVEEANHQIAEMAEARIKHRKKFAPIDEERAMWSGGPGFSGPQPPTPQDQTNTLGDAINARRERRQAARSGRILSGERA